MTKTSTAAQPLASPGARSRAASGRDGNLRTVARRVGWLSLPVAFLGMVAVPTLAPASASATKANTFNLSGQVTETATLNTTATCISGNVTKVDGYYDIRLYLRPHGSVGAHDAWGLLIGAKKTGHSVMPRAGVGGVTVGLTATDGASTVYSWYGPSTKGGKGSLYLSPGAKSGNLTATVEAAGGKAKDQETISGSWTCD